MRELWIGRGVSGAETEQAVTCEYYILIREWMEGCESYGVKVTLAETGDSAEIADITVSAERVQTLTALLHRNLVTPCTLHDVVADWL